MAEQTPDEQMEILLLVDKRLQDLRRDSSYFPELTKYIDEVERARSSVGKARIANIENRLLRAERECATLWAAYAAPAVDEETRRRTSDAKRRAVTDEQIDAAILRCKTQVDAAAELGITDRQLRTRLKNRKR